MQINIGKRFVALSVLTSCLFAPLSIAHFDDTQIPQSYRQSYFALLAANFGPLVAMVKGEIPFAQSAAQGYADDFAKVSSLNVERGFPSGSRKSLLAI